MQNSIHKQGEISVSEVNQNELGENALSLYLTYY
jgi:hypothetical protein